MKTYITIITLSFIVCYLEITNIHIEAIVQKNIILQQETISKKISQKELNHNTQKKNYSITWYTSKDNSKTKKDRFNSFKFTRKSIWSTPKE